MIIRVVCFLLFIHLTFSTMNNKKSSSMSFTRRRQLDERLRRLTKQCEQRETCQKSLLTKTYSSEKLTQEAKELAEIDTTNCVRRCISLLCYREIYSKDPLERGEIDVRYNQFKSCWIKEQKD